MNENEFHKLRADILELAEVVERLCSNHDVAAIEKVEAIKKRLRSPIRPTTDEMRESAAQMGL